MPIALDSFQGCIENSEAYIALTLFQNIVRKIGGFGTIRFCEVLDDCSVKRRLLSEDEVRSSWQSCLRSGEVLVSMLHASEKIKTILSTHGCPLLPLQEGFEQTDWLRLRSRFLGNWRNIHNVLRYMQKKCPHLQLQILEPNTGEIIVDCIDPERAQVFTLASLTQCLALMHAERIVLDNHKTIPQSLPGVTYLHLPCDANNSAKQPPAPKQPLQLQPKLERLNGTKRVTCVYDTTTIEDEDEAPRPLVAAAAQTTAVVRVAASTSKSRNARTADGDPSGAVLVKEPDAVINRRVDAIEKIYKRLDEIKVLLSAAISTGDNMIVCTNARQIPTPFSSPGKPKMHVAMRSGGDGVGDRQLQSRERHRNTQRQAPPEPGLGGDANSEDKQRLNNGEATRTPALIVARNKMRGATSGGGKAPSREAGKCRQTSVARRQGESPTESIRTISSFDGEDESIRALGTAVPLRVGGRSRKSRAPVTPSLVRLAPAAAPPAQPGQSRHRQSVASLSHKRPLPPTVGQRTTNAASPASGGSGKRHPTKSSPAPAAASAPVADGGNQTITRSTIQDLILRLHTVLSEENC